MIHSHQPHTHSVLLIQCMFMQEKLSLLGLTMTNQIQLTVEDYRIAYKLDRKNFSYKNEKIKKKLN